MPGLSKALRELIEGGVDAIPALSDLLAKHKTRLSEQYDLDNPLYHYTDEVFKDFNPDTPSFHGEGPDIPNALFKGNVDYNDTIKGGIRKDYLKKGKMATSEDVDDVVRDMAPGQEGGYFWEYTDPDQAEFEGLYAVPGLEKKGFRGVKQEWGETMYGAPGTEVEVFRPGEDLVSGTNMDAILANPEGSKLRQIAQLGIPASALAALGTEDAMAAPVEEYARPRAKTALDMMQTVKPYMSIFYPQATEDYVEHLAKGGRPNMKGRVNALFDWL